MEGADLILRKALTQFCKPGRKAELKSELMSEGPKRLTTAMLLLFLTSWGCGRIGFERSQDSADLDGAVGNNNCTPLSLDVDIVAAYLFEDLSVVDEEGNHPGSRYGTELSLTTEGPCDSHLVFGDGGESFVELPHSDAWNLQAGSIDLWLRLPRSVEIMGVITRDAAFVATPGHFGLLKSTDDRLVVRTQSLVETGVQCSDQAVSPDTWMHVGVNFGLPSNELWIDGVLQAGVGVVEILEGGVDQCDMPLGIGIDGNANPWAIGASTLASDEGLATPLLEFLRDGAVAQVRISSSRRDFSVLAK